MNTLQSILLLSSLSCPMVDDVVTAPPKSLGLKPFYKKYIHVDGYPIVSSGKVEDDALLEAAFIVRDLARGVR